MSRGKAAYLVLSALLSSGLGYLVANAVRPPASFDQGGAGDLPISKSSTSVPVSDQFSNLVVVSGHLLAYGEFDDPLGPGQTCIEAPVQLSPLRLLARRDYDCTIPVPGEQAAATYGPLSGARYYDDDLAGPGAVKVNAQLQIARIDPATDAVTLGPPAMEFAGVSNTWPRSVDTTTSVWAYDCAAGGVNSNGEAIQASVVTGHVETSVVMPPDCWSLLGADSAGAFVASYDSGGPIYFIANGATHARVVLANAGSVGWFYGAGDSMYIDVGDQGSQSGQCQSDRCGIWRLTGSGATPKLLSVDRISDVDTMSPVDGGPLGLLSVVAEPTTRSPAAATFRVVSIDPSTGAQQTLTTFRLPVNPANPYDLESPSSLAFLGHSLYVLVPSSPDQGLGTLYRYSIH